MISILDSIKDDIIVALKGREKLLIEKKERLEKIIGLIRNNINIEKENGFMKDIDKFKAFDMKQIEAHKKKYAKETKDRYATDERFTKNIDMHGDGLARFMCDAMKASVK